MEPFLWIWLIFTVFLTLVYLYQIAISIAGFKDFKPAPEKDPKVRFAIVVPAHNESPVIGGTLNSIARLDYPRDLFKTFVIADNCSDDTSGIASAAGAEVLVRTDPVKRGKGQALKWGLSRIRERETFDAYVIIDSDNIVSRNFLRRMNNEVLDGNSVLQGHLATKNPNDNIITKTIFATYSYINRFFELSRENLGLCCPLGGTGVCLTEDVLRTYGWEYTTLTEDLELTARLAMDGKRVRYVHNAKVFDEKPRTLLSAIKQRQRWMTGHAAVLKRYYPRLAWSGISRGDMLALDATLYLGVPAFMTLWVALDIWRMVFHFNESVWPGGGVVGDYLRFLNYLVFAGFAVWWIATPLVAMKMDGVKLRKYWYTSVLMVLMTWIMLFQFVIGLFKRDQNRWWHTKHVASLDEGISLDD